MLADAACLRGFIPSRLVSDAAQVVEPGQADHSTPLMPNDDSSPFDSLASRRTFIAATAGAVPMIAGCGETDPEGDGTPADQGDDSDPAGDGTDTATESGGEEETERDEADQQQAVEGVVGDRIEGDNLELVVEGVEKTPQVDEYSEAEDGNTFLIVTMAVKNRTESEFANFSAFMQAVVRDDEDYTYSASFHGTGRPLESGQLAPGEVARGDVVFELPEDAAGLELRFDLNAFDFTDFDRVTIDLESEADSIATLEQDLRVDLHGVGDSVSKEGWEIGLNEVRTEQEIGYNEAEDGHEYLIPNVTATNNTGDSDHLSIGLQMVVKDGDGWQYRDDVATYSLDRQFESGEFADGETRRGEIAYQVPEDAEPLYWAVEFGIIADGTKAFWQLG